MDNLDNLDKLIYDLTKVLERKYTEQLYLISSNLSVEVSNSEILQNWCYFLNKNNIELLLISTGCESILRGRRSQDPLEGLAAAEDTLLNLINRDQHKIKNKIIFPMYFMPTRRCYILTTRENAQKLVVIGSFEN